jgi:hypothetical protein
VVAGINHAVEYPRMLIPELTRRRERIGRRNLEELARGTAATAPIVGMIASVSPPSVGLRHANPPSQGRALIRHSCV